jgi:hypothetical protein
VRRLDRAGDDVGHQRLEHEIVLAIDQRDRDTIVAGRAREPVLLAQPLRQLAGGRHAREATAEDDDPLVHRVSQT